MNPAPYSSLEEEFQRYHTLQGAAAVLRWDAAVLMPPGSAGVRGEQLALLESQAHAILASPRVAHLLGRAEAGEAALEPWEQANLRLMRRRVERATALPRRLVAELAECGTQAESAWRRARQESDFELFRPYLESLLALEREKAWRLGERLGSTPYAALLDEFDPGRDPGTVNSLFAELGERLPGLVGAIMEAQADAPPLPPLPEVPLARQRQLAQRLAARLGFDFTRGRLDESAHPMTSGVPGDVRITSRYAQGDLLSGLMAVVHECGHALYEQALPERWRRQPVGQACSMTVHESQALFLERVTGHGEPFIRWLASFLTFELGADPAWEVDNLRRRLGRVQRGLIRVEADEATYPLHVLLRHELEQALLDGSLAVGDLPEAWNEAMRHRLGLLPGNDAEGCLQDVHWAVGAFGYFCTYALGSLMAAQLQQSLLLQQPGLPEQVSHGDFTALGQWLREQVHSQASRWDSDALLQRVSGRQLNAWVFLDHLQRRYLEAR